MNLFIKTETDTDIQKKLMVLKGDVSKDINQESRINIHILYVYILYIQIHKKQGSTIQHRKLYSISHNL